MLRYHYLEMDLFGFFDDFIAVDGAAGNGEFEELQDSDMEDDDRNWAEDGESDEEKDGDA